MNKVLFIASTGRHITNFHIPYIQRFRDMGWQVDVACGGDSKIDEADYTLLLPFVKRMFSPSNFRAMLILRGHLRKQNYNLMLCHTSLAAFFARLAVFGLRKRPAVCNMVHGYLFDDNSSAIKKTVLTAAEKFTAPVTDLIICMNEYDKRFAEQKKLAKRVEFIPGIGLNTDKYPEKNNEHRECVRKKLGFGSEDFVLLYAAEFSPRKSQHVLIDAMQYLPDNIKLVLPGSGELLEQCKSQVNACGIKDRVIFPGHVNEMGQWYSAADAAVSSSRSEGLPFNILEAMFYSLPLVASRVKGHTDLISERETGLLYEYGDSAACAKRILEIAGNKDLREHMGRNAKQKVAKYCLENVEGEVMRLYFSCLKN